MSNLNLEVGQQVHIILDDTSINPGLVVNWMDVEITEIRRRAVKVTGVYGRYIWIPVNLLTPRHTGWFKAEKGFWDDSYRKWFACYNIRDRRGLVAVLPGLE